MIKAQLSFLRNFSENALFLITVFNIFDTIGRTLGGIERFIMREKFVIILTYARFIFIGTTVGIAWSGHSGLGADWFILLNDMLFAITNGYCSSAAAVLAPRKAEQNKKEAVGIYVSLCLSFGIFAGSLVEVAMEYAVPKSA